MSISSISSAQYTSAITATASSTANTTASIPESPRHHHGGGGKFMQSILDALNQSGVSTGSSGTSTQGVQLQQFMHALFTALKQSESTTSGTPSTAAPATVTPAYANLSTGIQALMQNLNAGAASSNSLSTLQGDFQSLLASMQNQSGSSASTAAKPSLQSFLQTLLNNLQNQTSTSAAALGSLVSTTS